MVSHHHNAITYAPLYIHKFRLLQPHFLTDAEKFNITYSESQFTSVADKLRYYRYKKTLLQREVADYAGIERTTYSAYEENVREYYPLDVLARIAELLEVEITDLLDKYNTFLFCGQEGQIKELREEKNISQAELADQLGVKILTVKRWEQGKMRMTRKYWEKVFGE